VGERCKGEVKAQKQGQNGPVFVLEMIEEQTQMTQAQLATSFVSEWH